MTQMASEEKFPYHLLDVHRYKMLGMKGALSVGISEFRSESKQMGAITCMAGIE
jgi:hypothetical protein